MKNMLYTLLYAAIILGLGFYYGAEKMTASLFSVNAGTTYVTVSDGPWSDPATWQGGIIPPTPLPAGDSIAILNVVDLDANIEINGSLYIDPAASVIASPSTKSLTIGTTGTIINDGIMSLKNVTNNGTFINNNQLTVSGIFDNKVTGHFINNGTADIKTVVNDGIFENNGIVRVDVNFTNNGTGVMTGTNGTYIIDINAINNAGGTINGTIDLCKPDGVSNPIISNSGNIDSTSVTICGTSLPVEFLNLAVKANSNSATVSWTTQGEFNNKGFHVQVQKDDSETSFETVSFENGHNVSTVTEYAFDVNNLENGLYYFRLIQEDFDGNISYSETVEATIGLNADKTKMLIYPNPSTGIVNLKLSGQELEPMTIMVYNSTGKMVKSTKINTNYASTIVTKLELTSLANGTYFIKTSVPTSGTKKFIIKK